MEFKEFGILNFGKFNDEIIKFRSGINIIYGENEFGKSTIANFIDGIFYGFSRDSLKKRVRDELFEKCRPWNNSSYRGYIEINKESETYRIFRDFDADEVKILNKDTGLDLSSSRLLNKYSRIDQPGALFFDINRKVFKSTFFTGQEMIVPEEDAANDLKKKINNFATSLNENLNLNKVIDNMNRDIDKLGKDRKKSSQIGTLAQKLDRLEREKTAHLIDKENYLKLTKELKEKKDELKSLEVKYSGRRSYDIYKLKSEIENLKNNLDNDLKKYNMNDFERAIELNNEINSKSNRLDTYIVKGDAEAEYIDKDLCDDLENYKKAREKISELNINNYSKEMEFISVDMRNTKTKINLYILKIIVGIVLGICTIGVSFYADRKIFALVSIIFFVYSYFRTVKYYINKDLYMRLQDKLNKLKKLSIEKTGIKKNYDKYFISLMDKYSVKSIEELEDIFDEAEKNNARIKNQNEFNLLTKNRDEEQIKFLEKSITQDENKLRVIFEKYSVSNIRELRERFFDKREDNLELIISRKEDELMNLEKNFTPTDFYREESIEEIESNIRNKKLEISNLNGKVSSLEASVERLKDLEERSKYLEKRKSNLENRCESLTLARDKLLITIEKNRGSYLPKLKSSMEKILSAITSEKYKDIVIDKDFNIKILDMSVNKHTDVENLSLGTINQIYFSFRLAMAKILTNYDIPLVLDGSFDSYDDNRLRETMLFLKDYGQVLIFTSSKREIEILDDNKIDYNLINLR